MVLSVGSWIFIVALIPSLFGKDKPPITTSMLTGGVLLIYTFNLFNSKFLVKRNLNWNTKHGLAGFRNTKAVGKKIKESGLIYTYWDFITKPPLSFEGGFVKSVRT